MEPSGVSGPFMISQLAESPNCICWMDEGSGLWLTKAPGDHKALENAFLTFFEKHDHGTGSFKNKKFVAANVHLTTKGFITSDGNSKLIAIIESSRSETPMSRGNIGPGGTIIPTTSARNRAAC
jgi:hypothetical protein